MSGIGLDWYKREPAAYLKDTQGLSVKQHAVYAIVLDLIYANGGFVNNDPKWISGWISDMGSASVRRTISDLVEAGFLLIEGEKLTQKRAKNEVKTKQKPRENREKTERKPPKNSSELMVGLNENNNLASEKNSDESQLEKRREDNTPLTPLRGGKSGIQRFGVSEGVKMLIAGKGKQHEF